MAIPQKVGLRRSSVEGNIPNSSQIELGELAFNTKDGRIYFKDEEGNIYNLTDKFTKQEVEQMIGDLTTDDIGEGDNKYFTEQRVRDSVSASGDLNYNDSTGEFSVTTYKTEDFDSDFNTKSTDDLSEGDNLYFTEQRARQSMGASGDISYNESSGVMSYTTPTSQEIKQGIENIPDTHFVTDIEKHRVQTDPVLLYFL